MPSDVVSNVVPCTWYGPVPDEILSLPVERVIIPDINKNEEHIGERAIVHDGIAVRDGRRYAKWREEQRGYLPFNPALLEGLEPRPTGAQEQPPAPITRPNVASDAEHDEQRGQASLESASVGGPSPNPQLSDSGEQESNPFRRARLSPGLSVRPNSDNGRGHLFGDVNLVARFPRMRLSTSGIDWDTTIFTDQSVPSTTSAEVDPDDYGYCFLFYFENRLGNNLCLHTIASLPPALECGIPGTTKLSTPLQPMPLKVVSMLVLRLRLEVLITLPVATSTVRKWVHRATVVVESVTSVLRRRSPMSSRLPPLHLPATTLLNLVSNVSS